MAATPVTAEATIQLQSVSPTTMVVVGDETLVKWREAQRVHVPRARFTRLYKTGQWDGTRVPGRLRQIGDNQWSLFLSRGYLPRLQKTFPDLVSPYESYLPRMDRPLPKLVGDWLPQQATQLRDYQWRALHLIFEMGWGRIALPTNAGKGAVMALTARMAEALLSWRVLVLCDEVSVFHAVMGEIRQWGGEDLVVGMLESGRKTPPEEAIVVAMVPTLAKRLGAEEKQGTIAWSDWVRSFQVLLLDEADKATAPTWQRVLTQATASLIRVGFSGTFPSDKFARYLLDGLMGPVLLREKNVALIERKISAQPLVSLQGWDASEFFSSSGIPLGLTARQWRMEPAPQRRLLVYEQAIVQSLGRHQVIREIINPTVPTCILVNQIAHGQALESFLPGSVFLQGNDSLTRRAEVLLAFQSGSIRILIATRIFDRGTNALGTVADLILASGEGSRRQVLQRIGRGLRRAGGKEFLRLVDIVDRGHRFLERAAAKRIRLYHQEEFEVEVMGR